MGKIIENYSLYDLIGEGGYGKVYRAVNFKTNKQFAIKVVPIVRFKENPKLEECTVNEINTLSMIEVSPHIVKYVEMLKTPNNFYFIYEYCNGGTLEKLLRQEGRLPENRALLFFKQLVEAFKVLNKNNIMHRDLKPDNIFFHNNVLKLGDFGFCKNLESGNQMTSTMLGSPIYMAPEVLKGEVYTSKADIWSLGVVLFEMLFGYCPFESNSIAKLISVLQQNEVKFPADIPVSTQTQTLIRRLLVKDSFRRADWPQVFSYAINDQGFYEQPSKELDDSKDQYKKLISSVNTQGVSGKEFTGNKVSSGSNLAGQAKSFTESTGPSFKPAFDRNALSKTTNPTTTTNSVTSTTTSGLTTSTNNSGLGPTTGAFDKNIHFSTEANKPSGLTANSFRRPAALNSQNNKRKQIIEQHGTCAKAVKTALEVVKLQDKQTLALSYIVLKRVEDRLKKVNEDISVTDIELEDIVMALNNELRQLDRELSQIREELARCNLDVKGLTEPRNFLRSKFRENDPQLKAWFQMVGFLFGEKDGLQTNNNNKQCSHSEMCAQIKSKLMI